MPEIEIETQEQWDVFFDAFHEMKLAALRKLWEHFYRGRKLGPSTPEQITQMQARLIEPGLRSWQRKACIYWLEAVVENWRETAPLELLGHIITRDSNEVRIWRNKVLERDGFKCRRCGTEDKLEAHHRKQWQDHPEARLIVDNGITVCNYCHKSIHREIRAKYAEAQI